MPHHKKREWAEEKRWLVGPYIRLSKDDGNDESLSVTNQKKIIMDFFEREFEEPYTIVDWYIDDGISGTTGDERVAFQRAIHDMKSGRINCMPCKTLSRAFRNYADQGYYLEQVFPTYELRFISIGSPRVDTYLDPDAIIDGLELPINGLMNDRYAAKTSQDVRRTFDMKRRKGEFIGAFAPYGFIKDPTDKNKLIIDEEVAPVVRDIFHWRGNLGMSKAAIVKRLNELGVLNPTAYKKHKGFNYQASLKKNDGLWSPKTVSRILENEMYIGNMVQGKQKVISYKVHKKIHTHEEAWYIVKGTHEAVVDQGLFDKVRALDHRTTRVAPGEQDHHLLSGFMCCMTCGRGMRRKTSRSQRRDGTVRCHVYYDCSTRATKGVQFCKPNSIREDVLQEVILKAIQLQLEQVVNMTAVVSAVHQHIVSNPPLLRLKKQHADQQETLKKLTAAIDDLYVDWKSGDITKADYVRMKANFEKKSDDTGKVILHIEKELDLLSKESGEDSPALKTFLNDQTVKRLDRSLITAFIDHIAVKEGKEITIAFKFDNEQTKAVGASESNQI
ncbi:MAG: recombinase family protein [Defluviitaleaceae bacterium]|nr:recombinase family protein [Defluviitaleaceae bacterium]